MTPDITLTGFPPECGATEPPHTRPAWGAVFSMSLGVFALVTAEFLPASLLTPLAAGLDVSEGAAGQAVTATALVALVTSLFVTSVLGRFDRRSVLIGLSVLLIISNIMVALAPGIVTLLLGRVLMGIALGGFWSLSVAVVMRLVPAEAIPRALSILFMGVSAATVVAVPIGSYLGALIGWRGVFWVATSLAVAALLLQMATLPPLPARGRSRPGILLQVLRRPGIAVGMLAVLLSFGGHFTFFTYIRPFLENVTGVGIDGITLILFGFGIANFAGTWLVAFMIEKSLRLTMIMMPVILSVLAFALITFGGSAITDAVLIAVWGLVFAGMPVACSTWITRAMPEDAEAGGSLIVAAINFAIASGAGFGGLLLDLSGVRDVFLASGVVLALAALTVIARVRTP